MTTTNTNLGVALRMVALGQINPALAPAKIARDVLKWHNTRQAAKDDHNADGTSMTPPPVTALDTAGAPLTLPQQTRKARETVLYQRTDARRQSTDKQIADLKRSLDTDLAYIRNCIARGARDTALAQMRQAIRKQDRIKELADKWSRMMTADAVKAALEGPRPPSKIKVERKVKRYKRFSNN